MESATPAFHGIRRSALAWEFLSPEKPLHEERDMEERIEKLRELEALLRGWWEAPSSERRMWLPWHWFLDLHPLAMNSCVAEMLPRHQLLLQTTPQALAAGSHIMRDP